MISHVKRVSCVLNRIMKQRLKQYQANILMQQLERGIMKQQNLEEQEGDIKLHVCFPNIITTISGCTWC